METEETSLSILTNENIEKIKHINDLLKKEEVRVRSFAEKLRAKLNTSVRESEIWDYNYRTNLAVFSRDVACNKRNMTTDGNPIYEERIGLYGNKSHGDTDEMFYSDDWNLYCPEGHPLNNIHFCYTMHCIAFHSSLSWQDILDIYSVWLDLKVDYQFLIAYDENILAEFEKQSIPYKVEAIENIDYKDMTFEQRQIREANPNIFDSKNIDKLRYLNELLKKEEHRIRPFAIKLVASLNELLEKKQVDDFNYEPMYICHSITSDYITRYYTKRDTVEGHWPYKSYLDLFWKHVVKEEGDDEYYDYKFNHNWNYQNGKSHPLADIPFCYTMKTLYYESGLTLQDILDIDNIRISLEVDYQFFVEFGEPRLDNFEEDEIKTDS